MYAPCRRPRIISALLRVISSHIIFILFLDSINTITNVVLDKGSVSGRGAIILTDSVYVGGNPPYTLERNNSGIIYPPTPTPILEPRPTLINGIRVLTKKLKVENSYILIEFDNGGTIDAGY